MFGLKLTFKDFTTLSYSSQCMRINGADDDIICYNVVKPTVNLLHVHLSDELVFIIQEVNLKHFIGNCFKKIQFR